MWTNVFRIGGLSQISWFQFLPVESDLNSLPDKRIKVEQKDAATLLVLSSHLQLQKEGFLSAWTNSFVGPWDPSQGPHNPDEKIKLWLFIPGRHMSVLESAQSAVSRLRVVASGLWLAPGDSEEVAAALSQALRNRIERALLGLSYMRFGDVFSKYHPPQIEESFRRAQPTIEFIFAASEESLFVHAIISSKHIRALSTGDIEKVLEHSSNDSSYLLPVIISPHGMRGRLTGCCPNDLVKQVYFSNSGKIRTSNAFIGLPYHTSQCSGCQLRGQNCYVKVSLGCSKSGSDKSLNPNSNYIRNIPKHQSTEASAVGRGDQKGSPDPLSVHEKTFIYPPEAVLVPVLQTSFARSSLRRFWLQNWIGPSLAGSSFFRHCDGNIDFMEKSWVEFSGIHTQHFYNSSSNSNNSSISSISSSSSESVTTGARDLEADADSSCRQSGLSSNDQMETDCLKLGSKRPRIGITESYGQAVTVTNAPSQDAYKSNIGSMEVNKSAITGVGNDQIGSNWDWDDDDRGIVMDIQSLLSEFGDFGDFFENDVLPFGEPPGTAESSAIMLAAPDCADIGSSPVGVMDASDQMLLPVGLPSFDSFNPPLPVAAEEFLSKSQEVTSSAVTSGPSNQTPAFSTGEFDHLMKAEALMTFAAEYGAVETPASDSSSIFRNPYLPKSCKVESSNSSRNNYIYAATPPSSPCFDGLDEKTGMPMNLKTHPGGHDSNAMLQLKKYYTHVETRKERYDRRLLAHNDSGATNEMSGTSQFANFNSINSDKSADRKMRQGIFGGERILLSMKTVLGTEVECAMFQASMLRMRHILLSPTSPATISLSRPTASSVLNQLPGDPSTMTDNLSSRYEENKKESIPFKSAGDIAGVMLDGHLNAPVGVWRTVGVSKVSKPATSPSIEASPSLTHNSFNEESMLSYGQRQPLQELLDGIVLLVQQATSFVDLALDADGGDDPYSWLALQEHWRRGFCCGPSMVHAGCGGTLASCHSLDIAGVELVDPLSANIHASSIISLLHSDIKSALKSAFGSLDGPLSVTDWCRGRGQSGDVGAFADGSSAESNISECRDSSSTVTLSAGEAMSPSQTSVGGSSVHKVTGAIDGSKVDENSQRRLNQETSGSELEQQQCSRLRPSLFVLPSPAILVGYQDDWLKTSANSLQLWEKAPLEPYALPKPINYSVICPDIDPLTCAAADFFQQLGIVYETCKLGTHSPQSLGNQMEIDSGKWSSSGFVLLDCPQSMKIESSNASLLGSISDYFLSLSNGWDMACYLKSLSKALKALKIGQFLFTNQKEGISGPCLVIYVVCPFPEPTAVLKTVIESSIAVGSIILPTDRDRRSLLHSQVGKALSSSAAADETSVSNIPVVSGFSVPKLVLQIVTVDAIFRVTSPPFNELVILKEMAFTVYNKARRISRGSMNDIVLSSSLSSRSHSVLTPMTSIPGMWKDSVGSRIPGPSLPREGEIDSSLRGGAWENSWQTRTGGLSCDPNRNGDFFYPDEVRYMFEPLFILAESGSLEHGVSPTAFGNSTSETSKTVSDESSGGFMQTANSVGSIDPGSGSQLVGLEPDGLGSSNQKTPSLHCCYGWTEDWRWLVCIWTDARGELLDCNIFPFGGISSRQDTKGLQCLFVQVLQQGCQILQTCTSSDIVVKPRDFVITRIGSFYELEYLEWQKAIYSVGGCEVKKWPLQLRRSVPDGMPASTNGTSLEQQEMSLIQERTLPSSPSPLYSPHTKAGFMKGGLGQPAARKQLMSGQTLVDNSRGLLQWVQSISFVSVSVDHSLHLVLQADSLSPGTQGGSGTGQSGYIEGFTPVKSLGSTSASYMLIPSPSMRFLPPTPLQLPTCLTAESPPLAHLLHSKGSAIPLSTGFVVSRAVPSMRKDYRNYTKDEWPSVLSVSLIDYYGGNKVTQDKVIRGIAKQAGRTLSSEARDFEIDNHLILASIAAELHALSWMTVSPGYLERRTALPFHSDMVLRLRRLLHFAEKELLAAR